MQQDLTDMTKQPCEIVVTDVQEHDDGGATISFDLDESSRKALTNLGLQFVLHCAAAGVDIQTALDSIMEMNENQT